MFRFAIFSAIKIEQMYLLNYQYICASMLADLSRDFQKDSLRGRPCAGHF
jgi:hypothetical protein